MSRNNMNTPKEPPPGQPRLKFPAAQTPRAAPASPANTSTNGDDGHRSLIAKAVTMGLMLSGEDYTIALPTKLIQLAASAKDGKPKADIWEKVGLIGKILQECSFKDRMRKFRDEIMEKIEEKFDDETCRLEGRVKAMRKEVEDASNASTKLKDKVKGLVKDAEARGNMSWAGLMELEAGEVEATSNAQLSYANAAQAKSVTQHIQQPRHNPAIRDAELKDRRIIIRSEADSDWKLTEKEIVVKANLAMEKMLQDEDKGMET
ncbi:hypothetical protein C8J55DRAFT_492073 [Lentinula edodes]|uniref:Uncharacterized protein n=1 Tax=Lentinula lateritia TaxID=40482 RepID=A0A9W9DGS3_9AGAR|nr:hypothetical protein C8J55DRAFT_492073 [Lentinula edodes]